MGEGGIRNKVLPDLKVSPHKYLLIKMKKQHYNRKPRQTHLDKVIYVSSISKGTISYGVSPDRIQ